MRELARGLWHLGGFPPDAINVYMLGDVLIDAGTRWASRRILRQLGDRRPSQISLTHAHPDHQGCAKMLCERYGIPLACHAGDVPTMQGERPMQPDNRLMRISSRLWSGPPHPVARVLRDGEEVGGFRVVHAPGHTPGHVMFFREVDRAAVVGDMLNGMSLATGLSGLHEPPAAFCTDPAENRRSILTLAELGPSLLCFGHGPPLRAMGVFERFLERLEARSPGIVGTGADP
jgi:glyoxylase-like metal-dependent hydrolase (beta-lactamase superfamily II)